MFAHNRSFKLAGLFLLVAVMMACALPDFSAAPTPDYSILTPQALPTETAAPPSQQPTFTPLPPLATATPLPLPTSTSWPDTMVYDSAAQAYRLSFKPGWTWMQIVDTTTSGITTSNGGKRYVLSAMQGQVMSLYVPESWPFAIEVVGPNGALSDPNIAKPFWRGTLPVAGDYYVTVNTQTAGEFVLHVAINPPGQSRQFFEFSHTQPGFSLSYSDEFAPMNYIPSGDFKGSPLLVLEFIRPDFYGPTTNLGEAYFMVNTVADASTCTQVNAPNEKSLGLETINGYTFTKSQTVGVGAGNIYDQLIYRDVINGTCYEVVFFMHSGNIGNYTPGSVVEFDRAALVQKFEEVLNTFTAK